MANKHQQEQLLSKIASAPRYLPDFTIGLTSEQVKQRVDASLVNKTPKKVTKTYWKIFCDNFFSFFNIILFAIAALMIWAKLEWNYFLFLITLFSNIIIGLISDIRARRLVDKLRLITDPKALVVRDGKESEIPVDEVVLSDIIHLKAGDQICADSILIEGYVKTDESLLTGESDAIVKRQGDTVYSGSYVKSGEAYVRVDRVGVANVAEGIQKSAQKFTRPRSELKRSCLIIFGFTGGVAILIGLASFISWIFDSKASGISITDATNFYLFIRRSSGSLVAMIPTGLYLLTSLTLAIGVIGLAKKHMNVQELYCIEMLARVDTICFDKTGTLTDGSLTVGDLFNFSKWTDKEVQGYIGALVYATKDENSTAMTIKKAFAPIDLEVLSVVPFDSDNKYSAVSFKKEGTWIMGAPGFVEAKLNEDQNNRLNQMTLRGYRVLGIYHNKKNIENGKIPNKNELVALISFMDHIKPDAKPNIEWFKNNGVDIKVISGDNPLTVSEIANEVGVPGSANYISMEGVSDDRIPELALNYSVFGRVKPEQKALLVQALQAAGRKVAMTGDGVNDIIALKTADCSIAMASGSSAARNVAHMVSMDNDFSKLPDVVKEGRRVINNLQRTASIFLGKTIFAIIMSLAFLIASWCNGHDYPFNTSNMLIWELVSIGGGGFFLALQPSDERLQGSFMINVLSRALPAGIVECLSVFVIFLIYRLAPSFMNYDAAQTLSVILFTCVSYLVLLRVCLPIDKYRSFVFGAMAFFGAFFFVLDGILPYRQRGGGHLPKSQLMDLNYYSLDWQKALVGISIFIVLGVIYFALDYLISKKLLNKSKKEIKQ